MYGVHESTNYYYTVLEYCNGGEILDVVKDGKLNNTDAKVYFHQLVAVKLLHDLGITHRDLSLENILLKPLTSPEEIKKHGGLKNILKVCDFGLARAMTADKLFPGKTRYSRKIKIYGT